MTTVLAAIGLAVLFVVFGLVYRHRGCGSCDGEVGGRGGGGCGACPRAPDSRESPHA
jgi:hypothetical protein